MSTATHDHDETVVIALDGVERFRTTVQELLEQKNIQAMVGILNDIAATTDNAPHEIEFTQVCNCGHSQRIMSTIGRADVFARGLAVYGAKRVLAGKTAQQMFSEDIALDILLIAAEVAIQKRVRKLFQQLFGSGRISIIRLPRN